MVPGDLLDFLPLIAAAFAVGVEFTAESGATPIKIEAISASSAAICSAI